LSRGAHVRGDFIYRRFSPRRQASLDLILYFLFFFPGVSALVSSGLGFFELSYAMNEHSAFSPAGPVIWPFKAVIPVTGLLLFLQGIAETIRCVICIRDGAWPRRLHDVEETEIAILQQVDRGLSR
jgi:TRAP-type mannitol/chloroaromatic compound transport system permease small subunit